MSGGGLQADVECNCFNCLQYWIGVLDGNEAQGAFSIESVLVENTARVAHTRSIPIQNWRTPDTGALYNYALANAAASGALEM